VFSGGRDCSAAEFATTVVHLLPPTSTIRTVHSEIVIEADESNALSAESAAQCRRPQAVSPVRIVATRGNVGRRNLSQIRETLAVILDIA
jgi:hypothetical protein